MIESDYIKKISQIKETKNSPMGKILLILIILLTTIATYLFVVKLVGSNDKEIIRLKKANDELLSQNKVLDSLNATYMLEIKKKDTEISKLAEEDDVLKDKVTTIVSKIKSINYEKVSHYSDNFGSQQLKSYFADSLR
jgi:thermostable 8-oxoguanine DNA glycosylase